MVETDVKKPFNGLGEGFIRFSIKAEDTEKNVAVHEGFKEFARVECGDDYTLALQILLNNYDMDWKLQEVYAAIADLRAKVESGVEDNKEKDEGVF